jgi:multicomponent Na+:H+ antiporter subunit D
MIGFPPFNGFISKWFLALGSMEVAKAGSFSMSVGLFAIFMLLLSSFMNLMYYGPITYGAWFRRRKGEEAVSAFQRVDPGIWMWLPLVILGLGTLIFGIFPHFPAHFAKHFSLIAFH